MTKQSQLIVILVVLLGVALAAAVGVFLSMPATEESPSLPRSPVADTTSPAASPGSSEYDLTVLQRQSFLLLDKRPIVEGALPVQPPATTGKANPFL